RRVADRHPPDHRGTGPGRRRAHSGTAPVPAADRLPAGRLRGPRPAAVPRPPLRRLRPGTAPHRGTGGTAGEGRGPRLEKRRIASTNPCPLVLTLWSPAAQ